MSENIVTPAHWLVITNPKAGKRKFEKQSFFVKSELEKNQIPYFFKETEYSGHAIEIAKTYAKNGCLNFLVLGGDGSISEVINGIFLSNVQDTSQLKIALLPRGTGNDWGRFWKLHKNDSESMNVFLKGKIKLIDIGKFTYEADSQQIAHHFINSIGFGLDAQVADKTNHLKKYLGSFSLLYTIALLLVIFRYKSPPIQLTIDGKSSSMKLFTMNIANGPFTGGGIKQNPLALPYDGLYDMMVIENPTFFQLIKALLHIFDGKLIKQPFIKNYRSKEVLVQSDEDMVVETDGIVIPKANNCKVTILPSSIQMIVP